MNLSNRGDVIMLGVDFVGDVRNVLEIVRVKRARIESLVWGDIILIDLNAEGIAFALHIILNNFGIEDVSMRGWGRADDDGLCIVAAARSKASNAEGEER